MNLYARYLQYFAKKELKTFIKKKQKQFSLFFNIPFFSKPNKYKVKCPTQRTPFKQFIKLFIK